MLYNVTQVDFGRAFRARRSNANLEEIFLPIELTCSFQDNVPSIITLRYLKVSTLSKLVLSAVTEKLLTALSLWWVPISIILVLETLIVKKLDPFQLINLSRLDESLDSISLTDLPAKKK